MWRVSLLLLLVCVCGVNSECQEDCSGNGECKDDKCVCNEGFHGRDVFIDLTDKDCQIAPQFYYVGWCVIVVSPLAVFLSIWRAGTLYFGRKNKLDKMVGLCVLGTVASTALFHNFVLIIVSKQTVQSSLQLSIGLVIWASTYWPAVYTFIYMMLPVTAKTPAEGREMQKYWLKQLVGIACLGVLAFLVPSILAHALPELGITCVLIMFGCTGVVCTAMGLGLYTFVGRIAAAVKKSLSGASNTAKAKKMRIIQIVTLLFALSCALMFVVFAVVPFLTVRSGLTCFAFAALNSALAWCMMMMVFSAKAPQMKVIQDMKSSMSAVFRSRSSTANSTGTRNTAKSDVETIQEEKV